MKKKIVYELNVDGAIESDIWINLDADCNGNIDAIKVIGDYKAIKILDCNLPMLRALQMIHGDIAEVAKAIREDLVDLYEKLEKLEMENK